MWLTKIVLVKAFTFESYPYQFSFSNLQTSGCYILSVKIMTKCSKNIFVLIKFVHFICLHILPVIYYALKSAPFPNTQVPSHNWIQSIVMSATFIWDRVFKNEPSKICGRQPFKNLRCHGLLKHTSAFELSEQQCWINFETAAHRWKLEHHFFFFSKRTSVPLLFVETLRFNINNDFVY